MSLKEYATHDGTALADEPVEPTSPAEEFAHVPLSLIVESNTNPRTAFNGEALQELAEQIKARGVDTPITLRPLPAERLAETSHVTGGPRPVYELVIGARRFRASGMAGRADIPARIRRLTNAEALEIQMVENLLREDLTELEEAEGYEQLMRKTGINPKQLSEKIGKSKSFVHARLKLLHLFQAGREALRTGVIDFSRALLLARIPDEMLQGQAMKEITRKDYHGDKMGEREAANYVQQNYMLKLDQARFTITDASLLPGAGSCKECPKRTGHAPDLFKDVKGADVCTDPKCYHAKEAAHDAQVVQKAKEKGQTVIMGKEAEELATQGYNAKLKGYRRLDSAEDSPTDQPLRKIIGAQMKAEGIEPTMIASPRKKGELVATLPNDVVLRLLKTVEGQAQATKSVAKEVREFADEKKAKAEAKAKAQYEQHWRDELLARTFHRLEKNDKAVFGLNIHRHLALQAVKSLSAEDAIAIAQLLGLGKVGAHSALVEYAKEAVSPDSLNLLVIMQRDSRANDHSYNGRIANAGLLLVAGNVFGDDLGIVTNEVQAASMEKFFPKPVSTSAGRKKATETDGQKADLPHASAAQASTTREGATGKKTRPAAPAGATPERKRKATAQETMEGIAGALQGIEASAPADAGQPADVGAAVDAARDTVPGSAVAPQGIEAAASTAAAVGTSSAAGDGADGAANETQGAFQPGQAVEVNATARNPRVKRWVGKVGAIVGKAGPEAWNVRFPGKKGKADTNVGFHTTELQTPAVAIGLRVKCISFPILGTNQKLYGKVGTVRIALPDGRWSVMFPGKLGTYEDLASSELEVVL